MDKWEYTNIIITIPDKCSQEEAFTQIDRLNHQMNQLGKKGWELVQHVIGSAQVDAENKDVALSNGKIYLYTFKRPDTSA